MTSVVEFCGRESTGSKLAKKLVKYIQFFDLTFTDVHTERQKLGTILENKVVQKLKFSNDNNKKLSSILIFFNEKKLERFK